MRKLSLSIVALHKITFGALCLVAAISSASEPVRSVDVPDPAPLLQVIRDLIGLPDRRVPLQALPDVDERLVLVNFIQFTYAKWPSQPTSEWLIDRRLLTERLYDHVKQAELGAELIELYADCLRRFEEEKRFLEDIGAIKRGLIQDTYDERKNQIASSTAGVGLGFGYELLFSDSLASATEATLPGVVITIGVGVITEIFAKGERDAKTKAALKRFTDRYENALAELYDRSVRNATALATRCHWVPAEGEFLTIGPGADLKAPIASIATHRPRDPFVAFANANTKNQTHSAAEILNKAKSCMKAGQMLPENHIYDVFRTEYVKTASELAREAAVRRWEERHSMPSIDFSEEAISICRLRVAHLGASDHIGNHHLATVLSLSAQSKAAANLAGKIAKRLSTSPEFAYDYARILAMSNHHDTALEWLARSFTLDSTFVGWSRLDPAFKALRTNRQNEIQNVSKIVLSLKYEYGFLYDTITVTNDSAFDLTTLQCEAAVLSYGDIWTKQLTQLPRLASRASHTWTLGFREIKIRSDAPTICFKDYSCDQQGCYFPKVVKVLAGSPAERCGISVGDIVVKYNAVSTMTRSMDTLFLPELIQSTCGQPISLVVERQGVPYNINLTVSKEEELGVVFSSSMKVPEWQLMRCLNRGPLNALTQAFDWLKVKLEVKK